MSISLRKLALVQPTSLQEPTIRLAFATADHEHVNQHFGTTELFVIYEFSSLTWQLVEVVEYGQTSKGHNNDKLQHRIEALQNCEAMYCNAIGPSAVGQLLSANIQPVKVEPGSAIKTILKALALDLETNPKSWLGKSLAAKANQEKNSLSQGQQSTDKLPTQQRLAQLLEEDWEQ